MTREEIIKKWDEEKNHLVEEMRFCDKHGFVHEKNVP